MSDTAPRTVGFVGLGNMGAPMVARLAAAGHLVQAFDVDPDARARAVARGAVSVETLARAASGADAVILMLPSSAVVEGVVGDPAFGAALAPGTVVVDMSSSEPASTSLRRRRAGRWSGIDPSGSPASSSVDTTL